MLTDYTHNASPTATKEITTPTVTSNMAAHSNPGRMGWLISQVFPHFVSTQVAPHSRQQMIGLFGQCHPSSPHMNIKTSVSVAQSTNQVQILCAQRGRMRGTRKRQTKYCIMNLL